MQRSVWSELQAKPINQVTVSSDDPLGFGLNFPKPLVMRGFRRWQASLFSTIPTRQQIEETEPDWENDLFEIYHQKLWLDHMSNG